MSNALFNSIRIRPPKYNEFNLSHNVKTTIKAGVLTPFVCEPVLPGDIWNWNTEMLIRMAPFQAPVMHKCTCYTHFFFVPSRLIWDKFKEFITGGEDGESSPPYPRLKFTKDDAESHKELFGSGSLFDYLGFPAYDSHQYQFASGDIFVDALPFRAYQLIFNEYYRDQNLMDEVNVMKDRSGDISAIDNQNLLYLRNRSFKKDYFTSALPFAQRGDEVTLPLVGDAKLKWKYNEFQYPPHTFAQVNGTQSNNSNMIVGPDDTSEGGVKLADALGLTKLNDMLTEDGKQIQLQHNKINLTDYVSKSITGVDLSNVSMATINELRRAIKAQEFLEVAARGGSRYIEQIYSYFGVRSSDARLQRPEFLGGGKSPIVFSDVLQTSQTTESSPQAMPAGHGVSVQGEHSFSRKFEEHGYIIGIISVLPRSSYQQGMPRKFTKFDRLDYYWPQFAHLGEQEVKESEIYFSASDRYDDRLFGYVPRYAEYKFIPDTVHGDFRDSLSFWHMGRIFNNPPSLNSSFLTNVQDCFNRPFALKETGYDLLWLNIENNVKTKRLMPKYGTPLL